MEISEIAEAGTGKQGMRDYWLTQYLLAAVGRGYIILALVVLGLALWIPKARMAKLVAGAVALGLALILPMLGYQGYLEEEAAAQEFAQRQAKARELFEERCKTAGERIHRTVRGVDGVHLVNMRPKRRSSADQFALDDPYGEDYSGDAYPFSMLWGRSPDGRLTNTSRAGAAYRYVTYPDLEGGRLLSMRLTGSAEANGELTSERSPAATNARYGVMFEDISSRIDREHWIAGSRLKVVDMSTNEVLAERIGWMIDMGQGDRSGGRSPWELATYNACPPFPQLHGRYPVQQGQTRNFVEKVLQPAGNEK